MAKQGTAPPSMNHSCHVQKKKDPKPIKPIGRSSAACRKYRKGGNVKLTPQGQDSKT